jgi:hypothetical protein
MDFDSKLVMRLGFESYVDNLAVNLKEDGLLKDGYKFENEKYSVKVEQMEAFHGTLMLVSVRAYVDGFGWHTHTLSL